MTATEFYELGNRLRKEGLFSQAINYYTEAIKLDPSSPAAVAKQMLEDILNYYNKDIYNP